MNEPNALITFFEGTKLNVYKDSNGFPTVGVGHLIKPEDNLKMGDTITPEQSDVFLTQDLIQAAQKVDSIIKIPVKDYERAALISQAYNLRSFNQLAGHLQNEGRAVYKVKSLLYCKDSQGRTYNGLLIRRICELLLFDNKDWLSIAQNLQSKHSLKYTQSMIPKLIA